MLTFLIEILGFIDRLREWRVVADVIKLIEPSYAVASVGLLNHLLHFLGKSGKIEMMMKVTCNIYMMCFIEREGKPWCNCLGCSFVTGRP